MTTHDDDQEIAQLVATWSPTDQVATNRLWTLLAPIVRRRAHYALQHNLRPRDLETTALFHEAFLKLSQYRGTPRNASHLLSLCSWAIDKVLKREYERLRNLKASGAQRRAEYDEDDYASQTPTTEELVLRAECWDKLHQLNEQQYEIAVQRLWFDRTWQQIGDDLDIDPTTARAHFDNGIALVSALATQGNDAMSTSLPDGH